MALFYALTLIQWVRRKFHLEPKFLILFLVFWAADFASYLIGYYLQHTIVVNQLGFLNALRRIEYMSVFFIAASLIDSRKRFFYYLNLFFVSVLLVILYGLGQRFLGWPAIQTMNPAYAAGMILYLTPEARISSTFGGHFDLAMFTIFAIPIILGYFFFNEKKKYFGLFVLTLIILLYTAARSSFAAYLVSVTVFLFLNKKWIMWVSLMVLTAILLYVTGDLSKRLLQTVQVKQVFINEQTGSLIIDQKINPQSLPAGGFVLPGLQAKKKLSAAEQAQLEQQALLIAKQQAEKEAAQKGQALTQAELAKRSQQIAAYLTPQQKILCDISCATRLQIEWPRAVAAFSYNPLFGTGPSSITEATDNDYLRWLGEFGLIGTLAFLTILFSITRYLWKNLKKITQGEKYLVYGFIFGLLALMINATYIDVFESSKVAYIFWAVAGLFVGLVRIAYETKRE
jgi:O-antigen ligase